MTRIAAISDIHGNILALEAVLADSVDRHVDTMVNLGDHVSGPLWPTETIAFLMQQNWVQILGNHDRALVAEDPGSHGKSDAYACQQLDAQQKEWLHRLPTSATIHDKVLLFHGAPADDLQYLLETIEQGRLRLASRSEISTRLRGTRAPVMICGHSHVQRMIELADGSVIVNPGSVGLPAYEDNGPQPHIVESGSPYARYAIVEVAGKTCGVEFITVPYDSRSAAGQARRNDRPEWGIALETGFMKT